MSYPGRGWRRRQRTGTWSARPKGSRPVVVGREFGLVISLFTRPGHGPGAGVEHVVAEMPDAPLSAEQIRTVQHLARTAAQALRDGRTVLVRCRSGHNRSGLVVAQTLVELGEQPDAAVGVVRRGRSPWALNNRVFEDYLTTGLEVAGLLVGLEGCT
ncbi:protein phosphatase [Streptomyces sp. NPDC085524]|uniref:protein-tyrosine phosphatase family protein n=1 Tax=unclassified Streptomyces TaxID=2593676 RepID=UPI0035D751F2